MFNLLTSCQCGEERVELNKKTLSVRRHKKIKRIIRHLVVNIDNKRQKIK